MKSTKGFAERVALALLDLTGASTHEVRFVSNSFQLLDEAGNVVSKLELESASAVSHDADMLAGFWYGLI